MSVELKTIKLYGHLGKKFGKSFQLAVSSPAEAIKALSINIKGFREYLTKHSNPGYHIFTDKRDLAEDELNYNVSSDIIKIVPVTVGSGGFFKVIIGVVLIVVGTIFEQPWMVNMGYTMTISGVAEVLFAPPTPKSYNAEKPENSPSYIFNGPVNTISQGNPVSLCYGKVRVGSQVISAGLTSREIPI
jgi:predicted phage tail protein